MSGQKQFWAVGECMLELRQGGHNVLHTGAAGDTYNTAVYLKRLLPALTVAYVSALGDDGVSDGIRAEMRGHGLDDHLVDSLPGQLPGLYLIETDAHGERRFRYWRQQSAARSMLGARHLQRLYAALPDCGALLLTGITLAILDDQRRAALLELAAGVRALGGWVVLDSNYRPALWPADAARPWLARALKISSHALLSADDEALLHGDADAVATLARVQRGCEAEVVVKMGAQGCLLGRVGMPPLALAATPAKAVDTTAAGDSFNAGYLAARWSGQAPEAAAALAGRLAALVVGHAGAIIPPSAMAATLMDIQL